MKTPYTRLLPLLFLLLFTTTCSQIPQPQVQPVLEVGKLDTLRLDGRYDEWTSIPWVRLYADPLGNQPAGSDLQARIRLAGYGEGIAILAEVKDDSLVRDTINPWNGDAIEVFLSDHRGSENIMQVSLVCPDTPGSEGYALVQNRFKNNCSEGQENEIMARTVCSRRGDTLLYEIMIEPLYPGVSGEGSTDPAIQVYVDDSDREGDADRNQLVLFPVGHSYVNSFAMYSLSFADRVEYAGNPGRSRLVIRDNRQLELSLFGLEEGQGIKLESQTKAKLFTGTSEGPAFRTSFSIEELGIDPVTDTLFVFAGNELAGFHELLIAPRIYDSLEAPRFEREISIFKMRDRQSMPAPGGTLFIGSSSIRMWNCVFEDFPELSVIHRGFGGSTSEEALMYMDDIVLPYHPSAIVYYEGDNDVPRGLSPEKITENIRLFIERSRAQNPDVEVYLISPKPAIRRMHLWDRYLEVHASIKKLAASIPGVYYVDVASAMFDRDGRLREEIFIDDGVHMNRDGYLIWRSVLREAMGLDNEQEELN